MAAPQKASGAEVRVPPHNDEAERSLLGSVMLENRALDEVSALVVDEDFYRESHRHIYRAMSELYGRGDAIDVITLADHLDAQKMLDAVGGPNALARLSAEVPSAANVTYYATIVRRKAALRNFIAIASGLVERAYDDVTDYEAFMDEAEAGIFEITRTGTKRNYSTMREVVKEAFVQIEALYQKAEQITGVPSGFIDLDEITAGFQNSDLIIVAARPAMGKCLTAESEILLADGSVRTIEDLYAERDAELVTLSKELRFRSARASAFVDDGIKPVFRLTTKLGRRIDATAPHPLLTIEGWQPLGSLEPGQSIAVPRGLAFFGNVGARACEVALCAYLLGDGTLTGKTPRFTQSDPILVADFRRQVEAFGGVTISMSPCDDRTPTYRIVHDPEAVRRARDAFAARLARLTARRKMTSRDLARALGVSPSLVSFWRSGRCAPSKEASVALCEILGCDRAELFGPHEAARRGGPNPVTLWASRIGIWEKGAHDKVIPDFVFRLPRDQVALFLNRLFATDGWASEYASGQIQVGYASVSERLVRQTAHLLLRFGVITKVRRREVAYRGSHRVAWQLEVTQDESLRVFANEIGILSKQRALDAVLSRDQVVSPNRDFIPLEIWERIDELRGGEPWAALARRAGISAGLRPRQKRLSRANLEKLARALDDAHLLCLASSELYWDEIVSIEPLGARQVYDLTVPGTHNFVAEDVCVHNTALTLNMAAHAAIERKIPVAFFSLEMSNVQLALRMLCSEARIDQSKLRTGRMGENEWARLIKAAGTLSDAPIFLDDTPALPLMDFRSKARLLKSDHDIGVIFVDYLQLMKARGANIGSREQEISEISRSLKGIAKELEIPVVALAQLNRGVESRADKRPMNSDLRESGAIEQDADIISFIYRDEVYNPETEHKGIAEVILGKHRNGGLGTVRLKFFGSYTRFENLAPDLADDGFAE